MTFSWNETWQKFNSRARNSNDEVLVKIKMKISSNFVAFSKNTNFTRCVFILYCQCFIDIFEIAGAQKLEYHFWKHFIPLFHTYAGTAVKNYYECALHTTEQGFSLNFHPVMYNSGDVNYWNPTFSKASSVFQIWCANWFM